MVKKSILTIKSAALNGNPFGDKLEREIIVYIPDNPRNKAPLLVGLPPFGSNHNNFVLNSALTESLEDVIVRLHQQDKINSAIVAIPDTFTHLGGNQYLNSPAVGMWENFIIQEVIPTLKSKFSTAQTALFGKGSGGFGAYTLAMRNPGVVSGFAAHSPDAGFEFAYIPEFHHVMEEFRRTGGPSKWLDSYWSSYNRTRQDLVKTLGIICFSAFYSPNPSSPYMGIDFPFDWITGAFNSEVWNKWLSLDPARNIRKFSRQLDVMKLIYLDVGLRDEFSLIWGARSMDSFLTETGIKHVYEEYEDGHFGTVYRMEKSLSQLAASLS
ncbi:MAG: alpha/beta hydrolase-fold protein [Candidatus Thermoplasmatota archaeon]|nr:alpha/beta hydrolase-fold protein [Candidatus Thermoplasmatota archaeon]MCL5665540.1 alpha/beta hydrolase-fold protein [Candidatus Thermoplasmatota archaeon]